MAGWKRYGLHNLKLSGRKDTSTMKQIWAVILIVIAIGMSAAGGFCETIDTTDIGEGFSGVKWGTDIRELPTFTKAYTKDNVDFYLNPARQHCLEDGTPVNVLYGFFTNRLFAVYIGFETMETYDRMATYITGRYGDPETVFSSKSQQTTKQWTYKDVKMKLKMKNESFKMKFAAYYLPLSGQVNEELQEIFQKGKIEFFPSIKRKERPKGLFPVLSF